MFQKIFTAPPSRGYLGLNSPIANSSFVSCFPLKFNWLLRHPPTPLEFSITLLEEGMERCFLEPHIGKTFCKRVTLFASQTVSTKEGSLLTFSEGEEPVFHRQAKLFELNFFISQKNFLLDGHWTRRQKIVNLPDTHAAANETHTFGKFKCRQDHLNGCASLLHLLQFFESWFFNLQGKQKEPIPVSKQVFQQTTHMKKCAPYKFIFIMSLSANHSNENMCTLQVHFHESKLLPCVSEVLHEDSFTETEVQVNSEMDYWIDKFVSLINQG